MEESRYILDSRNLLKYVARIGKMRPCDSQWSAVGPPVHSSSAPRCTSISQKKKVQRLVVHSLFEKKKLVHLLLV